MWIKQEQMQQFGPWKEIIVHILRGIIHVFSYKWYATKKRMGTQEIGTHYGPSSSLQLYMKEQPMKM